MRINTNILSLMALRRLADTTQAFGRALERLASGKRINRAGDDASGLAISTGLESHVRGLRQATRNINDARGMLETAGGALSVQNDILQRMRELGIQAANGSLGSKERQYINEEFQALLEELNRTAETASFNGLKMLDGNFEDLSIQVGPSRDNEINLSLQGTKRNDLFPDARESRGDLSFNLSQSFASAIANPRSTRLGDFDEDGNLDLIVVTGDGNTGIRLGDGQGQFGPATILGDLGNTGLEVSDFNLDGHLDLVGRADGANAGVILLGDGMGGFQSPITYAGVGAITGISIGDVNNDGKNDIVSTSDSGDLVEIFLGDGTGHVSLSSSFATLGGNSNVLADFDGDGNLDLGIASLQVFAGNYLSIHFGDGNGGFGAIQTYFVGDDPTDIVSGDFDGDGDIDIAVSAITEQDIVLFKNDGSGQFSPSQTIDVGSVSNLLYLDVDNDGDLDIAGYGKNSETLSLLINHGSGQFSLDATFVTAGDSGGFGEPVTLGDINNDGILDLISADTVGNQINVYLQGSFSVKVPLVLDIATQSRAQNVLEYIDIAMTTLSGRQSSLGSQINRLGYAESNLFLTIENLEAAKSRILDTDIAAETAELAKQQILQQAGSSVLAQANVSLQIVLQLLKF